MIVTLSREMGSEGDAIAARVAAALGLSLVDRGIVHQAALAAGVPEDLLHKLMYEGQRSMAADILESLGTPNAPRTPTAAASSPLLGIFVPMMTPATVSLDEAALSVGLVIKDMATRGNMLLLGQGGQMWLRGYERACHVQVVAPLEQRVERVARRQGISMAGARRVVRANDQARADYLARYHAVRWTDPLLYHLVLNTGLVSVEAAVSLIINAAQVAASHA